MFVFSQKNVPCFCAQECGHIAEVMKSNGLIGSHKILLTEFTTGLRLNNKRQSILVAILSCFDAKISQCFRTRRTRFGKKIV